MGKSQSQLYQIQIEWIMSEIWMDFSSQTSIGDLIEIKEKIIRWHIVMTHTYLDYLITEKINRHYFKMWNISLLNKISKDKKVKTFNHQIMEWLWFLKKLEVLKELSLITENDYNTIQKINSLRNSLAHIFDFWTSKKHNQDWTIKYKNNDIFEISWIQIYNFDYNNILSALSI